MSSVVELWWRNSVFAIKEDPLQIRREGDDVNVIF